MKFVGYLLRRAPPRLRPYLLYGHDLLQQRQYRQLLAGLQRVSRRVFATRWRAAMASVAERSVTAQPAWHRDVSIDAKSSWLTTQGRLATKTSIQYPSAIAPVLLTVVIPCYNYGLYLAEAIASAEAQTVHSFEIIVVDDGSTDQATIKILSALESQKRHAIVRQTNQGLPAARNAGIHRALGEYICCLDADDTIEPTYLERMIEALEADRTVGFAYSWVQLFGDETNVWKTQKFDLAAALSDNHVAVAAVFRKDDWLLIGGFRPEMRYGYEDWDFWLRLGAIGRQGRVVPTPLFNHRRHGRTMTHEAHDRREFLLSQLRDLNPGIFADHSLSHRIKTVQASSATVPAIAQLAHLAVHLAVKNKKHALILVPWIADGGAERVILDIMHALSEDWCFTIVTSLPDPQLGWPHFRKITSDIIPLADVFASEQWLTMVSRIIETRGTQLILSHGSAFAYTNYADIKKRHPTVRRIDILHNDVAGGHITGVLAAEPALTKIVAVSDKIAATLQRNGVPAQKIATIRNGVDAHIFNPQRFYRKQARQTFDVSDKEHMLLWIGRLAQEKQPLEFVRLLEKLNDVTLVRAMMIGDGPMAQSVTEEISQAGLDNILMLNRAGVERNDLARYYAAADFLVMTSAHEGLPLVALEAMATGCPVATTNVGDLASIISDGHNGYLVAAGDPARLATILKNGFADPSCMQKMRETARAAILAQDLTLEAMIKGYTTVLGDIH